MKLVRIKLWVFQSNKDATNFGTAKNNSSFFCGLGEGGGIIRRLRCIYNVESKIIEQFILNSKNTILLLQLLLRYIIKYEDVAFYVVGLILMRITLK